MKTILHPDYWAEIPEGDYPIGLTEEQMLWIWDRVRDESGYKWSSKGEQKLFNFSLDDYEKYRIRIVQLKRFYIARFPVTQNQLVLFRNGTPAKELSGVLEEPYRWPNGEY